MSIAATFNNKTGWAGKTILYERPAFILQDYGRISAAAVMHYDRMGYLEWQDTSSDKDLADGFARLCAGEPWDYLQRTLESWFGPLDQQRPDRCWHVGRLWIEEEGIDKALRFNGKLTIEDVGHVSSMEVMAYDEASQIRWVAPDFHEEFRFRLEGRSALGLVDGAVIAGDCKPLKAGQAVRIYFLKRSLQFRDPASLTLLSHMDYSDVQALEIGGPGAQQSGGGFMGGGFGAEGAAAGMLVGTALNLLTTRKKVRTVICLQSDTAEVFVQHSVETPDALRMRLAPVFTILRQMQTAKLADSSAAGTSAANPIDRLTQLAALLEKGHISQDEFAKLKNDLLKDG